MSEAEHTALAVRWREFVDQPPTSWTGSLPLLGLLPLSWIYAGASHLKKHFFWSLPGTQTKVPVPVLSVGNLSVGGTGKTPLTAWIASHFSVTRGLKTVILTRGYGTTPTKPVQLVGERGVELVPRNQIGDEGALLIRACPKTQVVVSRKRALGAQFAFETLGAEVILLDDGLQYWRLCRDHDLITLDADNPLGNGRIFPAGPLRESPCQLQRGSALFVRGLSQATEGLAVAQKFAPKTPCYRAEYQPLGWFRYGRSSEALCSFSEIPDQIQTAACGIAQPESFFHLAEKLAQKPLQRKSFPDHHAYKVSDLSPHQGGYLMTEKDEMNLPSPEELPPLWILKVGLKLTPQNGARAFEELLDAWVP